MNKTRLAAILVVLAVIVGLLVVNYDQKEQKQITSKPLNNEQTLLGLGKALAVKAEIRDSIYMDWFGSNNVLSPLRGKQFSIGTVDIQGMTRYQNIKDIESVTATTLSPVTDAADTYFSSLGFTKNKNNSRTIGITPTTTILIGYEKDAMKCLIRLDEHTDPFGNFFCGVIDDGQIALQKQMGKTLPYGVTKDGITTFRVQKIEGNYAIGTYSETYSGYTWIAIKENNAWKIIWRQNDIALCSDMERLAIPESIYGNCYNGI